MRFEIREYQGKFGVYDTLKSCFPQQYRPDNEGVIAIVVAKLNNSQWHRDIRPLPKKKRG